MADENIRAYFAANYLRHGISFDGLMRFQREFHPELMPQVTGKELYQMVLEYTNYPEDRPFICVPYHPSGQPFFSPSELGVGNVYVPADPFPHAQSVTI